MSQETQNTHGEENPQTPNNETLEETLNTTSIDEELSKILENATKQQEQNSQEKTQNQTETQNNQNEEDTQSTPEQNPQELQEEIEKLKTEIKTLTEENARSRADHYNLQQEYSNYVRRTKAEIPEYKNAGIEAITQAILTVFDDIDAANKHGDLQGPFLAIATKLENTLKQNFNIERFASIGEEFDPNMHEALLVTPNPEVEKEQIGDIIQGGWKINDKILRAAKVVVFTPTE